MRRHLKASEVEYVTRPMTVFEQHLDMQMIGINESNPNYLQLWTMFLWSRQDEVLPKELFADILVTDWNDHVEACVAALNANRDVRRTIEQLNVAWRFNFHEKSWDRSKLEEWSKSNS